MKNRICHITTVHDPHDDRIFYKECISLAAAGYDVFLVAPEKEDFQSNEITFVPVRKSKGRLGRLFSMSFRAYRLALRTKATICQFHDPELMWIGILLRLSGRKVVYDVHEDLPRQILYKEWIRISVIRHLLSWIIRLLEMFSCLFFCRVVVVTDDIARKYTERKVILLRNFPVLVMMKDVKPVSIAKNTSVAVYAGGLAKVRGIQELVAAAGLLGGKVHIWLIGTFESEDYFAICRQEPGWKHVTYFGQKKLEEVYPYICAADIGIATLYPIKNYLTSLPVKAFEYMALGKPVVMSDFEYWRDIFSQCAIFVDPMDAKKVAEALNALNTQPELMSQLGNEGVVQTEKMYSWEAEVVKLVEMYKSLIK
ncbi:MAG: glycosyltransferase [Bacteroidetes bacterium]|nr:glycosyltransferase [Bacteroidota bacterium]MBU1718102.1 glycosyltransferase [Bacteroidota bacterium]